MFVARRMREGVGGEGVGGRVRVRMRWYEDARVVALCEIGLECGRGAEGGTYVSEGV